MKYPFLAAFVFAFLSMVAVGAPAQAQSNGNPTFEEAMAAFNYGDNELAARYFQRLAGDGDARAQYFLAYMMDAGLGMGKDVYGAAGWYEKSAKQDYLPAMVYMGYVLSAGHGATRNDKKAFGWYTRAAQMGDQIAQNNLATMLRNGKPYTKDLKLAAQWFLQSAMQGNMRAQYNLGYMYYKGEGVEKKDLAMALEWYRRAAEQGHKQSQMALARMYERGDASDGKPDFENAAIWYFHSAEKGDENAMYALGRLYLRETTDADRGLQRNPKSACDWYRKAAEEKNHMPSMVKLGRCYETGEGVRKKDLAKAATWYRRGAEAGDADGMLHMAQIYQDGTGVQQSLREAFKWYLLAAIWASGPDAEDAKGAAIKARTMISTRLTAQERDSAQREARSWKPFVAPTYGRREEDRTNIYEE